MAPAIDSAEPVSRKSRAGVSPATPRARRSMGAAILGGEFHVVGGFGAGGTASPDDVCNQHWVYDGAWRQIDPVGTLPGLRMPALCPYDGSIYAFGGCGYADGRVTFHNGLWRFDSVWREIAIEPELGPSPRYAAAMAVVLGQVLIFGGNSQTICSRTGRRTNHYFGDLWCFDLASGHWRPVSASGGPGARYGFGYVATDQGLYVFGGFDGRRDRSDLWLLQHDSLTWRNLSADDTAGPHPPARYCPALGRVEGRLVLFGGRSKSDPHLNFSDCWVFDDGPGWSRFDGNAPGYHAKAGYASDGACLWLFGGEGPRGHVSDLWRFDSSGWRKTSPARADDPILWG